MHKSCSYEKDDGVQVFDSTELGRQIVRRDHELVRLFIGIEDKKQLNELKSFVRTWSSDMISRLFVADVFFETKSRLLCFYHNVAQKNIYERPFDIYALYHMVEKNISPSLVVQAIKYGICASTRSWRHVIFSDQRYNIAILIDMISGTVIDVGFYGETFVNLKLEEDVIEDDKVEDEPEIEDAEEVVDEVYKEESGAKTVEDILGESEPGKESDTTEQYVNPGDFEDANNDFDDLQPTGVRDLGGGKRIGTLPGGRTVMVRPTSSNNRHNEGGFPTLEIQEDGKKTIKIRYTKK